MGRPKLSFCGDLGLTARLRIWRGGGLGEEVINPLKLLFLHLYLLGLEFSQLLPQACNLELVILVLNRFINDFRLNLDWVNGLLIEKHLEEPD